MPLRRICAAQYPAPAPTSSHRVALASTRATPRRWARRRRTGGTATSGTRRATRASEGDTREREACLSLASLFRVFPYRLGGGDHGALADALLRRHDVAREKRFVLFFPRAREQPRALSEPRVEHRGERVRVSARFLDERVPVERGDAPRVFDGGEVRGGGVVFSPFVFPHSRLGARPVRVRGVAPAARARVVRHLEPRLVQRGRERDRAAVRDARIAACGQKGFRSPPRASTPAPAPIIAARARANGSSGRDSESIESCDRTIARPSAASSSSARAASRRGPRHAGRQVAGGGCGAARDVGGDFLETLFGNAATRASAAEASTSPARHHRRSRHVTPPRRAALTPPHSLAIARAIGRVASASFGSRGAIGFRPNASRAVRSRRRARAIFFSFAEFFSAKTSASSTDPSSAAASSRGAHRSKHRDVGTKAFESRVPSEASSAPPRADRWVPATPRRGRRVHPDARCAANTSVGSPSTPVSWSRTAAAAEVASHTPSHVAGDGSTKSSLGSEGRESRGS